MATGLWLRAMARLCRQSWVLFLTAAGGCAHWGHSPKEEAISIDARATEEVAPPREFQAKTGLAPYKFKKTSGEMLDFFAEWFTCEGKELKGTILVTHDQAGFRDQDFCRDWLAQTLIAKGYVVLAVQRPGYGKSTGPRDLAGPQSIAALQAAVKEAQSRVVLPQVKGAYGYGTGAIAASITAKKLGGLEFLIVGGGVYDLEDTLQKTADLGLKRDIADLKKRAGDHAIEDRSIAYDVSGLPKKVSIYHGKMDITVPPAQAKAFHDSLESSGEYQVSFRIIEGMSHEVAPVAHRKVLEAMLDTVSVHK